MQIIELTHNLDKFQEMVKLASQQIDDLKATLALINDFKVEVEVKDSILDDQVSV
jgi:hypothetical protein